MSETKKIMKLPDIEMGKASIRKTLINNNGLSYEIEEEIEVPVFQENKEKKEDA